MIVCQDGSYPNDNPGFNNNLKITMMRYVILVLSLSLVCVNSRMIRKHEDKKNDHNDIKTDPTPAAVPFFLLNVYERNELAFTEGLSYIDGALLESTGNYGETKLQYLRLNEASKTVEVVKTLPFDSAYFGEGSSTVEINGEKKVIMMTYTQKIAVRVDSELKAVEKVFDLPSEISEGWGMTVYSDKPSTVLVSDGSDRIYECDAAQDLKVTRTYSIKDPSLDFGLHNINELEFCKGYLYANVYLTNLIVKIDLNTSRVIRRYDMEELSRIATKMLNEKVGRFLAFEEVMNGIAYNPKRDSFYITGKRWPAIFEIKFNEQFQS